MRRALLRGFSAGWKRDRFVAANSPGAARYLDAAVALFVLIRCAWVFRTPLRSNDGLLRFAEDDFYYYLKIAQNFAWHHRVSAFGEVWTNGFHPLYFVVLAAVSVFVHSLTGVFRFLWLLDTASATAVFLLTRRIFARLAGPVAANAAALAVVYLCLPMICCQMEVTLALPLGFAFLLAGFTDPLKMRPRRAALMGLLAALTFLARLDAGLIAGLYLAAFVAVQESRQALNRANAASFVLAAAPLPLLYLWWNHHVFGMLLPVSGLVKELRNSSVPSLFLFRFFPLMDRRLLLASMGAFGVALLLWKKLSASEKILMVVLLLDAPIFYGMESVSSDWPTWPWYLYALRFSAAGIAFCCLLLVKRLGTVRSPVLRRPGFARGRGLGQAVAVLLLLTAGVKLALVKYATNPWMVEIEHAAGTLRQFAETHRGVYAMGDRAGMFLMTTPNPLLQVEGLTMDRAYLEHLRSQEDLRMVLTGYGVNYYVSFVSARNREAQFRDGCFHAMEPAVAGPSSMHMRTMFCGKPAYEFAGFDGVYVVYPVVPG